MIRHIVAIDTKRGIARKGRQTGVLAADRERFSKLTKRFGGRILMGRKTFETIGRPLPDRENFVASRQAIEIPGVTIVSDLESFLREQTEDLWIIGGATLYEMTLPLAGELYITEIDADFNCDQFYPEYLHDFKLTSDSGPLTEGAVSYKFRVYSKR